MAQNQEKMPKIPIFCLKVRNYQHKVYFLGIWVKLHVEEPNFHVLTSFEFIWIDVARENEVKNHIKDPYKEPQGDPVEDVDPTELTGKLIAGQVKTRKLWKSWVAKKKTLMPAAKVENNAELSKTKFFKV